LPARLTTLGLSMWLDLVVGYVAGFGFDLLVFQALFKKGT
jgi:nitrate reductase NapE component